MAVLLDSNVIGNQSILINLQDNHPSDQASYVSAGGQALKIAGNVRTISSVKFYLKKVVSPTGNATAQIYASTGTVGSGAKPTGAALATSNNLDLSTLTTSYVLYELTFGTPLEVTAGNDYCLVLVNPASGVDATNYPIMGYGANGTHSGNGCYYLNSAWGAEVVDTIFYLYGTTAEDGGAFLLNFV